MTDIALPTNGGGLALAVLVAVALLMWLTRPRQYRGWYCARQHPHRTPLDAALCDAEREAE